MKRMTPVAIVVSGVAIITVAFLVGPLFSPSEFSWLRHSASEQASQQLEGAWIMRVGFVAYGLSTFAAALWDMRTRPVVRVALVCFGLAMIATAVWSNASILPDVSSDMREDVIHSIASGVVGTAFAFACAVRLFAPFGSTRDRLAWTGLVASVAIPLAMIHVPEYRGLLQRMMFVISFVIVIREFSDTGRSRVSIG